MKITQICVIDLSEEEKYSIYILPRKEIDVNITVGYGCGNPKGMDTRVEISIGDYRRRIPIISAHRVIYTQMKGSVGCVYRLSIFKDAYIFNHIIVRYRERDKEFPFIVHVMHS